MINMIKRNDGETRELDDGYRPANDVSPNGKCVVRILSAFEIHQSKDEKQLNWKKNHSFLNKYFVEHMDVFSKYLSPILS